MRSGDTKGALNGIEQNFTSGRLAQAEGPDGRLIAADELLLGIRLMSPGDARYAAALARSHALIGDYSTPMPAAQRLFLMEETGAASYPTSRDCFVSDGDGSRRDGGAEQRAGSVGDADASGRGCSGCGGVDAGGIELAGLADVAVAGERAKRMG